MDERAQARERTWLNPENLVIFIDELKDAGFNIGVAQYIAAQDLVLALVTEDNNLDHQRFKNMLGSLLCSSPQEQEDFRHRFDQWVHRMGVKIATDDSKAHEKARKLESELIKIRKQSKNWKRIWFFVLGIAIFAILGVSIAYFSSSPIRIKPPEEKQPSEILVKPPTPIEWQSLLIALFILLATFLLWRWWWRRRTNLFLKRNATTEEPKLQKISIADNDKQLFPDLLYLKIAQQFRKRIKVDSPEIDVERSFEKTLDSGGWFSPVYKTRQIPPEYLFLVDQTSYGDHQARFITEMIDRLVQNGVFIIGYYFDSDPRICFPMSGQKSSCRLAELAAKYSQNRLVVFSEGERLFSPVTGELESWVEIFAKWQDRAVLTPKPMENWGLEEIELAEQFMILPATSEGLLSFIKNLDVESSTLALTSKDKPPLPESLQERPLYWIDREPPEDYLIEEVLPSLKLYLGQDGYHWLSACAIFPELIWNLTLYLGNTLKNQEGETLLQVCNLSDMARLPWFRYGYMPDWLRLLLIAELSPAQDKDIREKLRQLLVTAVSGSVSGIQIEIAEKHRNSVSKITKPLLKLITDKASQNSPLRDYIFQDFMAGKNEKLAVKLPTNWRKKIVNQPSLRVDWRLWLQLIVPQALVSSLIFLTLFICFSSSLISPDNDLLAFIACLLLLIVHGSIIGNIKIFVVSLYNLRFNFWLKVSWIIKSIFSGNLLVLYISLNFLSYVIVNDIFMFLLAILIFILVILLEFRIIIFFNIKKRIKTKRYLILSIVSKLLEIGITFVLLAIMGESSIDLNEFSIVNSFIAIAIGFIFGIVSELFFSIYLVWILRQIVTENKLN